MQNRAWEKHDEREKMVNLKGGLFCEFVIHEF